MGGKVQSFVRKLTIVDLGVKFLHKRVATHGLFRVFSHSLFGTLFDEVERTFLPRPAISSNLLSGTRRKTDK